MSHITLKYCQNLSPHPQASNFYRNFKNIASDANLFRRNIFYVRLKSQHNDYTLQNERWQIIKIQDFFQSFNDNVLIYFCKQKNQVKLCCFTFPSCFGWKLAVVLMLSVDSWLDTSVVEGSCSSRKPSSFVKIASAPILWDVSANVIWFL